jgi:carbon-monoxide dehydrogenase large subunit
MLHAAFVRAPHAHAAILSVNIDDARAMPGVAAVFTARDMGSCLPLVPGFPLRDAGSFLAPVSRPILCSDRVRHVGDPVALVVATTEQAAVDAVDAVVVDYQTLPAISGLDDRDRVDSCQRR